MSTTLIHRRRRRRVLRRSPLRPLRAPPNGGNCSIRGATRRRHADSGLLMVQKPPLCLGGGGVGARGGRRRGLRSGCDALHARTWQGGIAPLEARHADRMLLMVQNPHHYPWCHAPSLCGAAQARPGWASVEAVSAGCLGTTDCRPHDNAWGTSSAQGIGLLAPRQRLEGVAGNDGRCHGWPAPR